MPSESWKSFNSARARKGPFFMGYIPVVPAAPEDMMCAWFIRKNNV